MVDKTGENETEITDFLKFESWNSRSRVSCIHSVFIYRVCVSRFRVVFVYIINRMERNHMIHRNFDRFLVCKIFIDNGHFRAPTMASEVEYCVATV